MNLTTILQVLAVSASSNPPMRLAAMPTIFGGKANLPTCMLSLACVVWILTGWNQWELQ